MLIRLPTTIGLLGLAILGSTGCSLMPWSGHSGAATVRSVGSPAELRPKFVTRAYTSSDRNSADIYMTDFTADQLDAFFDPDGSWGTLAGQIIHIRMFLQPKPGKTPIDSTACSATVRYLVIADGEVGVYSGAGFLMSGSTPGSQRFSGSITKASLRLARATDRFNDLLGASELSVSFAVGLDETRSAQLQELIEALSERAAQVE